MLIQHGMKKHSHIVVKDKFKGKLIHTTQYHNAREHDGKKVLVVGACTSGTNLVEYGDFMVLMKG